MKMKICKNCAYYSAHFKQYITCYRRRETGHCDRKREIKLQDETCADFHSNVTREKFRERKRLKSLDAAISSIIEISRILVEKEEEEKKENAEKLTKTP